MKAAPAVAFALVLAAALAFTALANSYYVFVMATMALTAITAIVAVRRTRTTAELLRVLGVEVRKQGRRLRETP